MRLSDRLAQIGGTILTFLGHPLWSLQRISRFPEGRYARDFVTRWKAPPLSPGHGAVAPNPLREYFDARQSGRGIWKWTQYFDAYHRHLSKFVGTDVHVVEIGVYSGGSLEMWQDYFGPGCRVTGIDIMPECKAYESDRVRIVIGDQGDRNFWREVRPGLQPFDILIDDGGHTPAQQRITLEETLPFLRPGGVFICEDVHTLGNQFATYVLQLADHLNVTRPGITPFQHDVLSVHFYPYLVVIERAVSSQAIESQKHGTEWAPFSTKRGDIIKATKTRE